MIITRTFPSGAYEIFELYKGEIVKRVYMGYTRKEAVKLFNQDKKKP